MVESAVARAEMDWECPRMVLARGGRDFEAADRDFAAAETDFALVEIAEDQADTDSGGAGTEFDSVEMDLAGMDLPMEVVVSALLAPSGE